MGPGRADTVDDGDRVGHNRLGRDPTLSRSLEASSGQLQWFSAAYSLAMAAALLPSGVLGDRYGRKRALVAALIIFGAASAMCAYSGSVGVLIAARAVLGFAAAVIMPLSMAVVAVIFRDQEERNRAVAIWITASVVGLPLGPIIGGWLLGLFWWGSVFLINVPLVIVGVTAVMLLVPESRSMNRPPINFVGMALSSTGLVGLTYGLIKAGQDGWDAISAWVPMVTGAVLLAVFVLAQRRVQHPLVDIGLFGSAAFTGGAIISTLVQFAFIGVLFATPQFFQVVTGTGPLGVGVRLLPLIGGFLIGSRLSSPLMKAAGPRPAIAVGCALLAVGLALGAATGTSYGIIAVWFVILGSGSACPSPPPGPWPWRGCPPSAADPVPPLSKRCARSAAPSAWPYSARFWPPCTGIASTPAACLPLPATPRAVAWPSGRKSPPACMIRPSWKRCMPPSSTDCTRCLPSAP